MAITLLAILLLICGLIFCRSCRHKVWESQSRLINADWLESEDKFHLLSRWGSHH